jgi:hypothetical protein
VWRFCKRGGFASAAVLHVWADGTDFRARHGGVETGAAAAGVTRPFVAPMRMMA